jgi:hypothetical protein
MLQSIKFEDYKKILYINEYQFSTILRRNSLDIHSLDILATSIHFSFGINDDILKPQDEIEITSLIPSYSSDSDDFFVQRQMALRENIQQKKFKIFQ